MPLNKKSKITQFHTKANSQKEAITNMKKNATEDFKVLGCGTYYKPLLQSVKENFINNKFY